MPTLILDPPPHQLEELLAQRRRSVDELLFIDPDERSVKWLALRGAKFEAVEHSELISLSPSELSQQIEWLHG
jgi:hypothetical protein